MAFSKYLSGAMLDHIFGKAVYTPPTNFYVGLSSGTYNDDVLEIVTTYGYDRLETTSADWSVADISGNPFITNLNQLVFPTATGTWGTIKEALLYDDTIANGGNLLARADAYTDKTMYIDDVILFLPGKLKFILI